MTGDSCLAAATAAVLRLYRSIITESSFVIIGTDRDRKTGAMLALLARAEQRGLAYAGAAFIALSGNERDELWARLEGINQLLPLSRFRLPTAVTRGTSAPFCWREASPSRDCEGILRSSALTGC
jgi:hypothetical protein